MHNETVLSHIVRKQFSTEYENVATEALAFILHSNESARNGMMKLLRAVAPDIPDLQFRTQKTEGSQQTEDSIRPDMCGYNGSETYVYVENKFWASLTENQPISYLKQLANNSFPSILLVVVPDARREVMWRELSNRLRKEGILEIERDTTSGSIVRSVSTKITPNISPILALTSWSRLLSFLELEVADDPSARSDLLQLQALCEAADSDAFVPISSTQVSDQRTPAFILQLNTIVQEVVDLAVTKRVLNITGLLPRSNWERVGRYARIHEKGVGFWFGIHFRLWKKYGESPLWLVFSEGWSRAHEVQPLLEEWAVKEGVTTAFENNEFVVAIDIALGDDKDEVIRKIVGRLSKIADVLKVLPPRTKVLPPDASPDNVDTPSQI
jgi:hypothetical protein